MVQSTINPFKQPKYALECELSTCLIKTIDLPPKSLGYGLHSSQDKVYFCPHKLLLFLSSLLLSPFKSASSVFCMINTKEKDC